jgi:hypothetical protein
MSVPFLPIERDIPIPPPAAGRGGWKHRRRYPWRQLQTGESFLVPLHGDDPYRLLRSLRTSAGELKGVDDRQFAMRIVEGGVRVWRTK